MKSVAVQPVPVKSTADGMCVKEVAVKRGV